MDHQCVICLIDNVEVPAIVIPERSNIHVCQEHYDNLGLGEKILEADVLAVVDPESALFREVNFFEALADAMVDGNSAEAWAAVEVASDPLVAPIVFHILVARIRAVVLEAEDN